MNTSSQLAAMRPYLDPWAKIDFLGLVSLIFGDKAQGFLSLQSAFFSSMHLANMPFAFPFFMENTQQLSPWVHVLHKPHLYKMKMRTKRKAPKYSWLKLWCSSLHITPANWSYSQVMHPFLCSELQPFPSCSSIYQKASLKMFT